MASSSEIRVSSTGPAFNEKIITEIGLNIPVPDIDAGKLQYQAKPTKHSDSSLAEFHHSLNPNSEDKASKHIKQELTPAEHRHCNQLVVESVDTPLSCPKTAQTEYDFKQMTELFHAENFETLRQQILRIDSSSFHRPTLDHFDFIAGVTFLKLKQFEKAIEHLNSITHRHPPIRKSDLSLVYYYLSSIFYDQNKYVLTVKYCRKSIEYYEAEKSQFTSEFRLAPPSFAILNWKLASVYRDQKCVEAAIKQYGVAFIHAKSDKDKLIIQMSLGNLLLQVHKNKEATEHFLSCAKLATQQKNFVFLRKSHGNLGCAFLALGNHEKAIEHFEKSFELVVSNEPTPSAIGSAYNNLGTAYQAKGDLIQAEKYFDLALSQAIFGEDSAGKARAYGNIGNIFMLKKEFSKAIIHYKEVISIQNDEVTKMVAIHNIGCACYEFATTKLKSLVNSDGKAAIDLLDVQVAENPNPMIQGDPFICCFHAHNFDEVKIQEVKKLLTDGVKYLTEVKGYYFSFNHDSVARYNRELWKVTLNSHCKTFHRLQDCLLTLGAYHDALVVAEETRTQCIMKQCILKDDVLRPNMNTVVLPLSYETILHTLTSCKHSTVYLSFTGSRLAIWYFNPELNSMMTYSFQADDKLNHAACLVLKAIILQNGGICRLINKNYSDSDKSIMQTHNVTIEHMNMVLEKIQPFVEYLNQTLPNKVQKDSILWAI